MSARLLVIGVPDEHSTYVELPDSESHGPGWLVFGWMTSNARPDEPSRGLGLRQRPIHAQVLPSLQRTRRKRRSTWVLARGIASSAMYRGLPGSRIWPLAGCAPGVPIMPRRKRNVRMLLWTGTRGSQLPGTVVPMRYLMGGPPGCAGPDVVACGSECSVMGRPSSRYMPTARCTGRPRSASRIWAWLACAAISERTFRLRRISSAGSVSRSSRMAGPRLYGGAAGPSRARN
jgi:hypothetical protein